MKIKLQAIYCPVLKLIKKRTVLEEGFFFTFHKHFFGIEIAPLDDTCGLKMKIFIINYAFISGIAKKNPDFKTVIHRKPKLGEIWNFGNFISNGYSRTQISVHAEQHGVENSHGSYIIEGIKDQFDFII